MDQDSSVSSISTGKIALLPEDLINKIAAGEVIERPASVIKELIENSIDADATSIDIEVKNAGKDLIKIKDNGLGMSKEDAKLSILRHATSKLRTTADLFNIQSLGFRGEALASISAVSFTTITTKQASQGHDSIQNTEATKITVHAGSIVKEDIAAHGVGTTIKVQNLFFNTPARKKFMKSNHLEIKHIINIITQYSLLHNNISFTLVIDGKQVLSSPNTNDQRANIAAIYGAPSAKQLLEVKTNTTTDNEENQNPNISVTGYVGKPLAAKSDKSAQSLFVNGRYVKSKLISDAIYEAYHSTLFTSRHPSYVLKVELDPKTIDVNVHPSKTEVKIEQRELVFKEVYRAVKATLESNSLIPTGDFKSEQLSFAAPEKDTRDLQEPRKYQFEPSSQTVFTNEVAMAQGLQESETMEQTSTASSTVQSPYSYSPKTSVVQENTSITSSEQEDTAVAGPSIITPEHQTDNFVEGSIKFPEMKILGQIHKTFFVAETPGGMLLIDQHVVEERVLYEEFMNEYLNKQLKTQTLLTPQIITLAPSKAQILLNEDNLTTLEGLGFTISHFGANDFSLSTIPSILGRTQKNYQELIEQTINDLENYTRQSQKTIHNLQEEIITMMSCRASVKAGDTMTIPQIKNLLKKLTECTLPYTCPHGRAIVIKISADELEKKFLRHG